MLHMREATNYIKWLLYWTRDAYLFFFHYYLLSPPKKFLKETQSTKFNSHDSSINVLDVG